MRWLLLVFLMISAGWMTHAGTFYITGQQWFESCWTLKNAKRDPATPQEAIAWQQCEPLAEKALYEAGFVFVGDVSQYITEPAKKIGAACPSSWSDIPIAGLNQVALKMIESRGGPLLLDRLLPAEQLLRRTFESRWPTCAAVALAQGFPKTIRQGQEWKFAGPCKPCEAEAAAQAERQRSGK